MSLSLFANLTCEFNKRKRLTLVCNPSSKLAPNLCNILGVDFSVSRSSIWFWVSFQVSQSSLKAYFRNLKMENGVVHKLRHAIFNIPYPIVTLFSNKPYLFHHKIIDPSPYGRDIIYRRQLSVFFSINLFRFVDEWMREQKVVLCIFVFYFYKCQCF